MIFCLWIQFKMLIFYSKRVHTVTTITAIQPYSMYTVNPNVSIIDLRCSNLNGTIEVHSFFKSQTTIKAIANEKKINLIGIHCQCHSFSSLGVFRVLNIFDFFFFFSNSIEQPIDSFCLRWKEPYVSKEQNRNEPNRTEICGTLWSNE